MAIYDAFPYTNFHELNLQWLLKKLKELEITVGDLEPHTFDIVENMKHVDLQKGYLVITKGYYEVNDGGAGCYYITDQVSDTEWQELLDNGLYANLIVDGAFNVNALGADSTGVHDSSRIFNKVFRIINKLWLTGDYKNNTVVLNGKYLWNNQVIMPPCARMTNDGYTTILTDVAGSALVIDYLSTLQPSGFAGNKQDWLFAELINFKEGGIFKNIGTAMTNTCIEIGRNSDIGATLPFSRYMLKNFRIYNYEIAMKHNRFHNYMGKFENISFESNTIGVQYGIEIANVVDSGENMSYINCLFAQCTDCVKWYTDGFDSSFVNCSFDFVTNCFNDYGNKGYKKISLVNCHLEGFTYLCNKLGQYGILSFDSCSIMYTQHGNMFANIATYTQLNFISSKLEPDGTAIYDPTKLIDTSTPSKLLFNNFIGQGNIFSGFLKNNRVTNFDAMTDGSITLTNGNFYGGMKLIDHTAGYTAEIVTDNYLYTGHKSMVLTCDTASTAKKSILLQTDFIPVNNINVLTSDIFYYNCRGTDQIKYFLYDEKQNLIYEGDWSHNIPSNSNKTANQWYMSSYGKKLVFPVQAYYAKVQWNVINMNNDTADAVGTVYKIGGLITM